MPLYGWVGLAVLLVSEAGTLARIEPFWTWHTAIAWTGYILLVDAIVWTRRGSSWIRNAPAEFAFLAIASIPFWLVFEFYNLFIDSWDYLNLPDPPLRYFGYAWAFATIWPAIFETADLVASFRARDTDQGTPKLAGRESTAQIASIVVGVVMLILPFIWPSPWMAAPVWLGFIFLLDPINARLSGDSLFAGRASLWSNRVSSLMLAGFICGFLWEFWNYWARARWVYTVPILPDIKIFEMPVLGYLGFPAFALECFTMYVFVRHIMRAFVASTRRLPC
jgi:hypothetical protein